MAHLRNFGKINITKPRIIARIAEIVREIKAILYYY